MKEKGLVSNYTVKQFKLHKPTYNNDLIKNELNRNFKQKERMNVIVSGLTYVNVNGKWNYICTIIDLYNREIVGYAASKNKDAKLVKKAINSINYDLSKIILFHADRGNEFKNQMIDDVLETFDIRRSLSASGVILHHYLATYIESMSMKLLGYSVFGGVVGVLISTVILKLIDKIKNE